MILQEFEAIIADIESNLEGEGYELVFFTGRITRIWGAWQWLPPNPNNTISGIRKDVIVVSQPDKPPFYVTLASIEAIQLKE